MENKFEQTILPGNYTLTKSYEISKITKSGSLWYIKKWIVLYYYIFSLRDKDNKNRPVKDYISRICDEFDSYIDSMPNELKSEAKKFFYPEGVFSDFKNKDVKDFLEFAPERSDKDSKYYKRARKAYFCTLMGIGGQSGIKKELKKILEKDGYNIDKLYNTVITSLPKLLLKDKGAESDIIKLISKDGLKKIKSYKKTSSTRITKACEKYLNKNFDVEKLICEFDAPLRNERQVMFYFGFFFSRNYNGKEVGFSSLTELGEVALRANWRELFIIWEHQKLKMISQTPINEIKKLPSIEKSKADYFSISYSPYYDIIRWINNNSGMSNDEYSFIVSRLNACSRGDNFDSLIKKLKDDILVYKDSVRKLNRKTDLAAEDFKKIKKMYIMGIESNYRKDFGKNIFGMLKRGRRESVEITDQKKLSFIYKMYGLIEAYKNTKYYNLYLYFEKELKRRYVAATQTGKSLANLDREVQLEWFVYINHTDEFMLATLAVIMIMCELGYFETDKIDEKKVIERLKNDYPTLVRSMGKQVTKKDCKNIVSSVLDTINSQKFDEWLIDNIELQNQRFDQYDKMSEEEIWKEIEDESEKYRIDDIEKKRNAKLSELIKRYHSKKSINGIIACECCGRELFITRKEERYSEAHHIIPFNKFEGPDHFYNLICLCPDCHRKLHYLPFNDEMKDMYKNIQNNCVLQISMKDRYSYLLKEGKIKAQSLSFLVDNKALTQKEYDELTSLW